MDFSEAEPAAPLPSWAASCEVRGGSVAKGAWRLTGNEPVGMGQFDVWLNRSAELPALAVTLALKDLPKTDLSINLHNADGEMVAVDLFGNLTESAKAGRTDTFIVPLSKFPEAVRLSIRRIQGPVELQGLVAFPVVEALEDMNTAQKEEFARLLGERLAGASKTVQGSGPLRTLNSLDRPEATTSVLGAADYPVRSWTGSLNADAAFSADCAGTCYRFFTNLYFSIFPEALSADKVHFVSSDLAMHQLLSGRSPVALTSIYPTESQRETFKKEFGYPMTIVPIALDAVEVLVHPANKFDSMSFETLRRVFARDGGGTGYWDEESGLQGPIMVGGGHPTWGTSQFFAEKALGGAEFRADMVTLDVAYANGVEAFVAGNQNAIGFAQHTRRTNAVKVLALGDKTGPVTIDARTVNDGTYPLTRHLYLVVAAKSPGQMPEGVRRFADLLLSREGQTAVADAGSFPLTAEAVRQSRRQLALP